MENIARLQRRLLKYGARAAMLMTSLCYFGGLILVTRYHWSFMDSGVGDMMALMLASAGYALVLGMYLLADRRETPAFFAPTILCAVLYMGFFAGYAHRLKGEDTRAAEMRIYLPEYARKQR